MKHQFLSFGDGFFSFYRGIGLLLRSPRLQFFAILPFILGFIIFCWVMFWGFSNLGIWVEAFLVKYFAGTTLSVFYGLSVVFVWIAFLLGSVYGAFLIMRLIATPFNALLAERALIQLGVLQDTPFEMGRWLKTTSKMFLVSLLKTALFLVLGILFFILSLIPGLGLIAGFGFFLIIAFDCVDYSYEALQFGLRERLGFFRQNFLAFSGLALSLSLVFLIPGLNFFLFPAAVVGGSDLVAKIRGKAKAIS